MIEACSVERPVEVKTITNTHYEPDMVMIEKQAKFEEEGGDYYYQNPDSCYSKSPFPKNKDNYIFNTNIIK